MRRSWLFLILLTPLVGVACGPGQVAVSTEIEVPDPETEGAVVARPLAELEIQFLPFDRDVVFDSMEAAFGVPEPSIPPDLLASQNEIALAQAEWNRAEAVWGNGRERLQSIVDEMEPLNQAEAAYVALFREFQDVEAQVARAERVKDQAFREFTDLQEGYISRRDSMRLVMGQWADEAFAESLDVFALKVRESGQAVVYDTTNAQGLATVDVPPGNWWVYAYYEKAFSELYWNIPITVVRGDPQPVFLSKETAEERPIF